MMKARLLTVSALLFIVACKDNNTPTQISSPVDPSKIISDGAHGGNKDFFFLPPMVPLPVGNPDFELGKFNNSLRPSLRIEICKLKREYQGTTQILPKTGTLCDGDPIKKFAPGTIQVVNLPLKQNGWWTAFGLPADGFYYALWDTRQSNLNTSDYYRIKVFIDGATDPLGVADVDPMASLLQWKYTLTGQVIQLVDDVMLPITFRVEKGGGSALCGDASLCFSSTVSNSSPTGSQTVTVDPGSGAIAGATFPNGWLPANGPQNVVVTVAQVDIGTTDPVTGESTKPCHLGLRLQQFPGCFNFSTTPRLAAIDESGRQFAVPVTVAVCYSLQGSGDAREKYAEMYASGPNEPPHPLSDASDAGILSAATRNCNPAPVIGAAPSNKISQLASAGWHSIKKGFGSVFGVKTAYGVDLGLGGIATAFSNIGPALEATIQPVGATSLSTTSGDFIQAYVRVIGSNHHDGQHENSVGLSGMTIHFTAVDGNTALGPLGESPGAATELDVVTDSIPIDPESPVSGGGYAAVNWRAPATAGTYHITADGPALGGPITFTVTVTAGHPSGIGLAPLSGYDSLSIAYAINDAGHAVGYASNSLSRVPAIWVDGVPRALPTFGEDEYATAINTSDEIIGWGGRSGANHAFRWKDGTISDLGSLSGMTNSVAIGINSFGRIVGYSYNADTQLFPTAWLWDNGVMTELGHPGNARGFQPTGINDAGQIIGHADYLAYTKAWLLENGSFTELLGLSFVGTTAPTSINANGVVVGYSSLPLPSNSTHAVLWTGGTLTDLGVLPGDTDSYASAVSPDGRVVGTSQSGNQSHAFLWEDGQMTQLPPLGTASNYAVATGINSNGDISGYSIGNDGLFHAVVWHKPRNP